MPLASLGEVGGDPQPAMSIDAVATLHDHHADTARRWPATLLAGTTHDSKRSEDVRAAGLALAAEADRWVALVDDWLDGPAAASDVDPAMQWLALQTVVTTPGLDADRLEAFLVKAAREADLHTSWTAPAERYEHQRRRAGTDAARLVAGRRAGRHARPPWPRRVARLCSPSG